MIQEHATQHPAATEKESPLEHIVQHPLDGAAGEPRSADT